MQISSAQESPIFILPPSTVRRSGERRSGRQWGMRANPPRNQALSPSSRPISFWGRRHSRRRHVTIIPCARGFQVLRRITSETSVELKILSEKWQLLLVGIVFQFVRWCSIQAFLHSLLEVSWSIKTTSDDNTDHSGNNPRMFSAVPSS